MHTAAPELFQAAMKAPLLVPQGPVKTKFGYHIFIITEEETLGDTGVDGLFVPSFGSGDGTL
ncbi:MAG: hypothetical protein GWN88_01320 [Nitrospinaceae bacterium]|nr:hypothetical protein [Nitrospinaceae bacterium]NIU42948.1 hypothetical protein [Nitrospinaceae bacterium]NIW57721.1 hypothetical protein [Nitrospinaceae bacterium]